MEDAQVPKYERVSIACGEERAEGTIRSRTSAAARYGAAGRPKPVRGLRQLRAEVSSECVGRRCRFLLPN